MDDFMAIEDAIAGNPLPANTPANTPATAGARGRGRPRSSRGRAGAGGRGDDSHGNNGERAISQA